ncbi:MAG: LysR family transcriptional regulator [Rhodanobacter sp.]|nr:MAG: LysR family transcriptional regulator [Rhodanobacter sp.]TAM07160.1 MAG: LysR family transcriptional regulator [Rhodanobacter sp.]TAM43095.1 MAG: LysR family transcriptional regulator [Rhodanobacter sp.]
MTLNQLRYLVAIADAGLNVTLAAEHVHATQPGLSRQLKQLEDELGFLLFVRKGRSLASLTEAGEHVLVHARRLLAEAANIRDLAANQRGERNGRLTLVTTHTQARYVLPEAIAAVRREFPAVSIRLHPLDEADILARLARSEDDLAVISTSGAVPESGIAVPLYRWCRVVLVRSDHALARHGESPDLRTLSTLPLVSYESSRRPESSLRRAFEAAGLPMQLAMTAHDADLIKTYVRSGIGVGILAEMAITLADTDLRVLPAPAALPECIAWAVLPRGRVLRAYTLRLLREIAPQVDALDLRRAVAGNAAPDWPAAPAWRERHAGVTTSFRALS